MLACDRNANAPASSGAATAAIIQETTSNEGWAIERGDVDCAFLNGRYLDEKGRAFDLAPKCGLPAVPELG